MVNELPECEDIDEAHANRRRGERFRW